MNIEKFIEIFKLEMNEELDELSQSLFQLEEDGSDNDELIDNIFINVHTIKGSSSALYSSLKKENKPEYSDIIQHISLISTITHNFEDFLEDLKEKKVQITEREKNIFIQFEEIASLIYESLEDSFIPEITKIVDKFIQTLNNFVVTKKNIMRHFYEIMLSPDEIDENFKHGFLLILYRDIKNKYTDCVFNPTEEELLQEKDFEKIFVQINTDDSKEDVEFYLKGFIEIENILNIPYNQKEVLIKEEVRKNSSENTYKNTKKRGIGSTLKIEPSRIDEVLKHTSQLVVLKNNLNEYVDDIENEDPLFLSQKILELKAMITGDLNTYVDFLQESVLKIRMTPLEQVFLRFPAQVNEIASNYNKKVSYKHIGSNTEIDKTILDELPDVLIHIIRNSICHGIETEEERKEKGKEPKGSIIIEAKHERNMVIISIKDDGKGIDIEKIKQKALEKNILEIDTINNLSNEEVLDLIFFPGITTQEVIDEYSGRGIGMEAVRKKIDNLKGSIKVYSQKDIGTTIELSLPFTTSIIPGMIAKINDEYFTFPISQVEEVINLEKKKIKNISNRKVFFLRDKEIPIIFSSDFFNLEKKENNEDPFLKIIVLRSSNFYVGFTIESYLGKQDIVVKDMGALYGKAKGISGCNILGDGSISLIVDSNAIIDYIKKTTI